MGTQHKDFAATYGNHNHLAGYLEMVIPITIGLLIAVRKGWAKALCGFSLFFLCIALTLTLSRGGWISGIRKIMTTNSRLNLGITLGSLGGIVAIMVHSVSDFNLHLMANAILFAVLAGLMMAQVKRGENSDHDTT